MPRTKVTNKFLDWLNAEMEERGWGVRETARRAGVSHPTISDILSLGMSPSFDTCIKLADAFMSDPTTVVRLAGLLPAKHDLDKLERDLVLLFPKLSKKDKEELLYLARKKVELSDEE